MKLARLPFAPLEARVDPRRELTTKQLARELHIDARTVCIFRRTGVTWPMADRLAVTAGTTVWNVWGPAWAELCETVHP